MTIPTTTTFAATTTPPAETTTPMATGSTTTGFEDLDSTTTDMEQNPTSEGTIIEPPPITMGPGSPQSQSDSQLLAIVLGAVGGLIVVLLFGIIVLLVVVILGRQRRKYSMQYIDDRYNIMVLAINMLFPEKCLAMFGVVCYVMVCGFISERLAKSNKL